MSANLAWAASIRILGGEVLQTSGISAGRGRVIDWRSVRSGEELLEGGDAFDQAALFVALAGEEAAAALLERDEASPAPEPTFGVRWSDPENRREPEGWILRDGVRRWTGTRQEAERKAAIYQANQWEGGTTTYEAAPSPGEI